MIPAEFNAVTTELQQGTTLIEASAGTGKTFSIATMVLRFIVEHRIPLPNILCVTFTNDATEELTSRIRRFIRTAVLLLHGREKEIDDPVIGATVRSVLNSLPEERKSGTAELLRTALSDIDTASVFTIHGFCRRMLTEFSFESGTLFNFEVSGDIGSVIDTVAADFIRHYIDGHDRLEVHCADLSHDECAGFLAKHASDMNDMCRLLSPDSDELHRVWRDCREELLTVLAEADDVDPARIASWRMFVEADLPGEIRWKALTKRGTEGALRTVLEHFSVYQEQFATRVRGELFTYAKEVIPRRCEELGIVPYDELIRSLHRAVNGSRGAAVKQAVGKRFAAVLIDEFQDTDHLQYDIFSGLFGNSGHYLFFIGDPKQSIYRFRGADIAAYRIAAQQADRAFTLLKNYRSDRELTEAVNNLFTVDENIFPGSYPVYRRVASHREETHSGPAMFIWHDGDDLISKTKLRKMLSHRLASSILSYRSGDFPYPEETPPAFRDMAVLVGSRFEAETVERILLSYRIPVVSYSSSNVFGSDEARGLLRVARAVRDPSDEALVRCALLTRYFSFNLRSLEQLLSSESRWERTLVAFREFHNVWRRDGFLPFVQRILQQQNVKARLLSSDSGKRSIVNTLHIAELVTDYEMREKTAIDGSLQWLEHRIELAGNQRGNREHERRVDNDDDAVKIYTFHGSKGLEFPVVFLPFTWRGTGENNSFFTAHENGRRIFTNNPELLECHRKESDAENRRLFYVGVTRAEHHCHVYLGKIKDGRKSREKRDILTYVFSRHLQALCECGSVTCLNGADFPPPEALPTERIDSDIGAVRRFTRTVDDVWGVTSFSALADTIDTTLTPAVTVPDTAEQTDSELEELPDIFLFPAGPHAGTTLHEIFEIIDFTADDYTRDVRRILRRYNLFSRDSENEPEDPNSSWVSPVCDMVKRTLSALLPGADTSLDTIPRRRRMSELSFHFPVRRLTRDAFQQLYPGIGRETFEGFMHGFIDLVFEHNGRYYIVDWKSNLLASPVHYRPEYLAVEMRHHRYDLQSLIYSVALHLHLSSRVNNYSFDEHFGGVYYLFLRGIGMDNDDSGILFNRPDGERIRSLTALLTGGEDVR